MTDRRQRAGSPTKARQEDDVETLAYVPQQSIKMLEDDEEAQRSYAAFEFFLSYADELEAAVADDVPWPPALTEQAKAALEGLDDEWIDGIADALTGETLTIDAGMTAVADWIHRHLLR